MTRSQTAALAAYQADADLRGAKQRMGEAMPEDGWLKDYLTAVTPLTDAPVEFHLASGLAALAGAVGNRMHVQSWGQSVYPHIWAVLVAPSSFWRKSTSINMAEALLRAADETALFPSDFSREKFLAGLEERPSGLLTIKEFGGFLTVLGRDFMGGLKENLTELFDGPDLFTRALQSKTISIRRPAVTILAATTLDWLESRITDGDLRGGFLARYLFITAKEKASSQGLTGGLDPLARMRLVDGLHALTQIPDAQVEYGPGVRAMLDDWMRGWEDEVGKTHHRSDLSGFAVRLQTYCLKLAMLYRASVCAYDENLSPAVIDDRSVDQAIAYCRVLWANVAGLIDDDIAITKEARELRRLVGIVGQGIDRSSALRLSHLKSRDFDQYLETLVQSHQVSVEQRRASEVGLDRQRDSAVKWIAPVHRNGHAVSNEFAGVSAFELAGIPSELEVNRNGSEPEELQGSSSDLDSSSTSHSSSSHRSHRSPSNGAGVTRARAEREPEAETVDAELEELADLL